MAQPPAGASLVPPLGTQLLLYLRPLPELGGAKMCQPHDGSHLGPSKGYSSDLSPFLIPLYLV